MKIYTRTGDDGNTGLQGGLRISKSHVRITAYGAIDEANAVLGVVLSCEQCPEDVRAVLGRIQNDLFVLGADLSNPNLGDLGIRVTPDMAESLEKTIDRFESELPTLTSFVLPGGGTAAASHLHHARAVVRRAESLAVELSESEEINLHSTIYLNRLSDLLFVLARVADRSAGRPETPWVPSPRGGTPGPGASSTPREGSANGKL